jgi:hypothetical protein
LVFLINIGQFSPFVHLPWCVRTLKIVGPGEVEVSDLCNFEFCDGYFDRFLITDRDHGEEIRIIIFPKSLFDDV